MKKITLATVKSFIRKNAGTLYISNQSSFDGMTDCVETSHNRGFRLATPGKYESEFGVSGAWFVGSSRDYFERYEDESFTGFAISNCCGSFILAIPKPV